ILREIGKTDRLVVDNYALDIAWEREVRPFVDEIFVIDDLANRKHDCDILLDQNFYLNTENRYCGLVPENCKLLFGPRHALLREEFYEARKHLKKRDGRLRNVLVFYGGSDLTNETMKALHALRVFHETQQEITVDVISGGSNPRRQEIKAFCEEPHVRPWLRYHVQVDNMADYMVRADLMLGAGGSTTWERCFLELPAIVTAVAENQERIAKDCAAAGYITYLGTAEEVTAEQLISALHSVTRERLMEQRSRMRKLFENSGEQKSLYLRKATEADAELLFCWRNDAETRENSFQTEPIPYGEHIAWLEATFQNPAQEMYILCEGNTSIGQVRLSTEGDMATVSYSIGREYRAQGYGRAILQLAENLCVKRGKPLVLRGYVKKKNIASQVVFETLGYTNEEEKESDYRLYVKHRLQYSLLTRDTSAGGGHSS
ncbi:MAG: UDP-2,4-diacetamido-2,4,6-trideoxy-beta-L-altropyranose hydrolase, partial [Schwartzia sp.]|nr:UDP-2,4-diacetamido-2,4,6-trideoxy-beta-L-altropyranose hydrolase [Schwartzia sp. (in: firmicutes)]